MTEGEIRALAFALANSTARPGGNCELVAALDLAYQEDGSEVTRLAGAGASLLWFAGPARDMADDEELQP